MLNYQGISNRYKVLFFPDEPLIWMWLSATVSPPEGSEIPFLVSQGDGTALATPYREEHITHDA